MVIKGAKDARLDVWDIGLICFPAPVIYAVSVLGISLINYGSVTYEQALSDKIPILLGFGGFIALSFLVIKEKFNIATMIINFFEGDMSELYRAYLDCVESHLSYEDIYLSVIEQLKITQSDIVHGTICLNDLNRIKTAIGLDGYEFRVDSYTYFKVINQVYRIPEESLIPGELSLRNNLYPIVGELDMIKDINADHEINIEKYKRLLKYFAKKTILELGVVSENNKKFQLLVELFISNIDLFWQKYDPKKPLIEQLYNYTDFLNKQK